MAWYEEMIGALAQLGAVAASHLWQATLFGLLVMLLIGLLRSAPAKVRHDLYLLASIKFLLPSALLLGLARACDLTFGLPESLTRWLDLEALMAGVLSALGLGLSAGGSSPGALGPLWLGLAVVWGAGALMLLSGWIRRRQRFAAALATAQDAPAGPLVQRMEGLASQLGLRRPVRLVLSREVLEPGVWGIRNPVVVLPEPMPEHLSQAELEIVLLHELVHVKRRDNLIGCLQMLMRCALWFHPLVWWIDRRILEERERACDDRVLELSGSSETYLRSLAKVLRFGVGWRLAGTSSAADSDLRRRIDHIRSGRPARVSMAHRGALAAVVCLWILFSAASAGLPRAADCPTVQAVTASEAASRAGSDVIEACRLPSPPCDRWSGVGGGSGTVRAGAP